MLSTGSSHPEGAGSSLPPISPEPIGRDSVLREDYDRFISQSLAPDAPTSQLGNVIVTVGGILPNPDDPELPVIVGAVDFTRREGLVTLGMSVPRAIIEASRKPGVWADLRRRLGRGVVELTIWPAMGDR